MVVLGLLKWRAPSCLILLTLLTQWSLLWKHTSDSQLQQIQNRCLVWFGGRGRPQKCDRFYIDGCALSKQIQIGKWMDGWMDGWMNMQVDPCVKLWHACVYKQNIHIGIQTFWNIQTYDLKAHIIDIWTRRCIKINIHKGQIIYICVCVCILPSMEPCVSVATKPRTEISLKSLQGSAQFHMLFETFIDLRWQHFFLPFGKD